MKYALLVGLCISGTSGLIYEVAWTRELSLVFGSTVYAVALMLTAYMAGLSIGGFVGGRFADKPGIDLVRLFGRLEFGIGFFALLTIPLIRALPSLYYWINYSMETPKWLFFLIQLLLSFLVMVVPTTLMGATFPVASKIAAHSYHHLGQLVGTLYSVNTLGSIIGSASAGFFLIPAVGVRGTILIAALGNFVVAALLHVAGKRANWWRWAISGSLALLVGVLGSGTLPGPAVTFGFPFMLRYTDYAAAAQTIRASEIVFNEENEYGGIVVMEHPDGTRVLYCGGFIEGSNESRDAATAAITALLPFAYNTDARTALQIGLGTGLTAEALLRLPLDRVDTVEINPLMDEASEWFVEDRLRADERWTLAVDDARSFVAHGPGTYDLVSSSPSWPLSTSVANLYTLEFFESVEKRLSDDGVFCQWAPQYILGVEDFKVLYRTWSQVFDVVDLWTYSIDGSPSGDILIVGAKDGARNPVEIAESVQKQVDAMHLGVDVEVMEFDAPKTVDAALNDPTVCVNTDDRPVFEFGVVDSVVARIGPRVRH